MNGKQNLNISIEKDELSKLLRIADPFLMIDKVYDIIPGKSGLGIKTLSNISWFYKCHFIDNPVMPGTLQQEAMLQTVIAVILSDKDLKNRNYLISKSSCNFYSKIENEGELKINAELLNYSRGGVEAKANIIFNEKKVSDGLFKLFDPSLLRINE